MAFEFRLPDIGEGVVEGEIVKWHVRPGQSVKEDDPLVEVMTDKATVMIPSPRKGKILETRGEEGGIVKVGAVLLTLDTGDGKAAAPEKVTKAEPAPQPAEKKQAPSAAEPSKGRALATPALRKMAQDMGIDINTVAGTGPGGRITREDIVQHSAPTAAKAPATPTAPSKAPVVAGKESVEEVPFRGLRKKVAEKMVESKTHAVHYTYVDEIDMTELVNLRSSAKDLASERRIKLTFLPFIIKALVEGLKKFPLLNASLDEKAGKILIKHHYHIGIGVATPDGLTVVVIKHADQKSLFELAQEIDRLSEAARQNKISLEDLKGSTFTITSLGTMGGMFATPVINYPEVAIVGIHKIEKRPVVHENQIVIRDRMYMSLSFDHRVVDGAVGAEFTQYVKKFLENPALMFIQF
ncbi:MAG TPA: dihydrolipoamide acetyltransferase family protein [Acidobacteriota bacterium]|nr:dihydrolipoamide acetyltransferase family protein [Acidobacteriota bacterium]